MERRPHGTNGNSMSRRVCKRTIKELGADDICNGRSIKKDKDAI